MAITVTEFDNPQVLSVILGSLQPPIANNYLHQMTGVAVLHSFTGVQGNNWTRDTCSFTVPGPDGNPFVFDGTSGIEVAASAIAFPATVENLGGQGSGFGVDSVTTTVVTTNDMSKSHTVTLIAHVAVRGTQASVLRLGFQVNVLQRDPIQ